MYVQNPKKKSYFFLSVDPDPQYYVGDPNHYLLVLVQICVHF